MSETRWEARMSAYARKQRLTAAREGVVKALEGVLSNLGAKGHLPECKQWSKVASDSLLCSTRCKAARVALKELEEAQK